MEINSEDLTNKVCIVTGANSGIGKEVVRILAKQNARVIMICRNKDRGKITRDEIMQETNNKDIELYIVDLSSQIQIRQFTEGFRSKYKQLHLLVNNAGPI